MYSDKRGVPCTAASQTAVDAFDAVVDEYLAFGRNTGALLKQVAAIDPEMPMQHVLRGYFFHLMGNAALAPRARKSLDMAEPRAASLTRR